jgi:hypothetical protein
LGGLERSSTLGADRDKKGQAMKEVFEPLKAEPAKASQFSQGLIDLMTKFEAHERPPIAKRCTTRGAAAMAQALNARR